MTSETNRASASMAHSLLFIKKQRCTLAHFVYLLMLLTITSSIAADPVTKNYAGILHPTSPAKPSFLYMLIDDIGWADLGYNGGIGDTPNIDAWARRAGSIKLQDFHSYTVCSPTRASILTGRNHFRDCVDHTYRCREMTTCVPDFEFAPSQTYTVGDAVRGAPDDDYHNGVYFAGKWHLGSFYNDSEFYGGKTSSPETHGFDHFNATVGVAPTMTTNCLCKKPEWEDKCQFGHNHANDDIKECINYWWDDAKEPHGVANLTWPTEPDDALYLVDAFQRFLLSRMRPDGGTKDPFFAQISFHNCHIPFVGSAEAKKTCMANETCSPPQLGEPAYNSKELDYYACITQLDTAVGQVLQILDEFGYYNNTMVWFSSDNGPEMNCPPKGFCKRASDSPQRPVEGPGTAGPLRGRKRDMYEGGHRVPAIVSWPAYVGTDQSFLESWELISTTDFLPTVMDVLNVDRPPSQRSWGMDGRSILSILKGKKWTDTNTGMRELGFGYFDPKLQTVNAWAFRYGNWKYVEGSASCAIEECKKPQLYFLENDLGEKRDLSDLYPEILIDLQSRFSKWHHSVMLSRKNESICSHQPLEIPPSLRNIIY